MGSLTPAPYVQGRDPYDGSEVGGKVLSAGGAPAPADESGHGEAWRKLNPIAPAFPRKSPRRLRSAPASAAASAAPEPAQAYGDDSQDQDPEDMLAAAPFDYGHQGKKTPPSRQPLGKLRWLLVLGERVAAAAALLALGKSDLSYLLGFSRRRRYKLEVARASKDVQA